MGRVLDELARRLRKARDDRGIVLWFDPERAYCQALEALRAHEVLSGVSILVHDGSHLALRHATEPYLNAGFGEDSGQPAAICYVPEARDETDHALIELEYLAAVAEPGGVHDLNTRLAVVGKAALKGILPPESLDEVVKKIEKRAYDLADLEQLGGSGGTGALDLIFQTSSPVDVILVFLTDPGIDAALVEKDALASLARLLDETVGFAGEADDPATLRKDLERFLLGAELALRLGDALPAPLAALPRPESAAMRSRLLETVERWRSDARLTASYAEAADRVEARLRLSDHVVEDLNVLADMDIFHICDLWRQAAVTRALLHGADDQAASVAEHYEQSFWVWSDRLDERELRWRLLRAAARLLTSAERVEAGLAGKPTATEIAARYTSGEAPWCELDEAQRRLETWYVLFQPEDAAGGERDPLEQLVERVRARYRDVANDLAEAFTRSFADAGFRLTDLPLQREIFASEVRPRMQTAKTAYILVDALRYEMARALIAQPPAGWDIRLSAAVASIPTLTPVGMASLLPGAEQGLSLELRGSSLDPRLASGVALRTRDERMQHLGQALGGKVVTAWLHELMPPNPKLRTELAAADFVVVTGKEIDEAGENLSTNEARNVIDGAVDGLRRVIGALRSVGGKSGAGRIERIVVVADHGHIFGGDLSEGEKIEPPGPGAHRRIWIGRGGAAGAAYVRFRAKDVGLGGDLEFATPWNLSAFKTSGRLGYLHGGLSPQELLIPVVVMTRIDAAPAAEGRLSWAIRLGGGQRKITSRVVTLAIEASTPEALPAPERLRIRAELRVDGEAIPELRLVSQTMDEEARAAIITRDPDNPQRMRPAEITLVVLSEEPREGMASVHLFDAETGVELARQADVPISLR